MTNSKTINKVCDCGCDVRGLTRYQLSGYRKNFDKITINKTDIIDAHLDNNEHLMYIDFGYVDKHTAIKKAENIIKKSHFNDVEWFEIWDITNTELIKTINI